MSPIPITSLYAAALALLVVALLLRVVLLRNRFRVGIGAGGQEVLGRAVRAHANAIETVPLALLLMLLVELGSIAPAWLHGAGIALVAGRGAHALGLSRHAGMSAGRLVGTVLTLGVILFLAGVLVGRALA